MRIYILAIFLLTIQCLGAQVGINTENPIGIFHIDTKKDSPTSTSDDVVVDVNGNTGIGVINPSDKLHIKAPSGTAGLKISNGSQAQGKVLISDTEGNAAWGIIRGSGGVNIKVKTAMSFPARVETVIPLVDNDSKFQITNKGNYLVTLRWWTNTATVTSNGLASGIFRLKKNGIIVDEFEAYASPTVNQAFSLTITLLAANCVAGDYLEIYLFPSQGGSPWLINTGGTIGAYPSIVFFVS